MGDLIQSHLIFLTNKTMKLNKLWAGALAFFALTSCNQDLDVETKVTPDITPATREVFVNLTVGSPEQELRMVYGVDGEKGKITGLDMVERNLNVRLAVKRGENGTPVTQDVLFVKTAGSNAATYSGPITVPTGAAGDYFIAAAVMSEDSGSTYGTLDGTMPLRVKFSPKAPKLKPAAGGKIDVPVPYVANWSKIELNTAGDAFVPKKLNFSPQGTVLRLRFKNTSTVEQHVPSILFTSPRFSENGYVDFANHKQLFWGGGVAHLDLPLETPLTLAPQEESAWHYVWVAPFKVKDTSMKTYAYIAGDHKRNVLETQANLPRGSVSLKIIIDGKSKHTANFDELLEYPDDVDWTQLVGTPRNALSYFATHAVNQAGDTFVQNYRIDNPDAGAFTYADAMARFSTAKEFDTPQGRKKYRLPTRDEFKAIMPYAYNTTTLAAFSFYKDKPTGYQDYDDLFEEGIRINGMTKNYLADYRTNRVFTTTDPQTGKPATLGVAYAVRFKDGTNYHRTAFRYQFKSFWNERLASIIVTARHIGDDENIDINTVANEAFWDSNKEKDVERAFPLYGISTKLAYKRGQFWASDMFSDDRAYTLDFHSSIGYVYSGTTHTLASVILIEE